MSGAKHIVAKAVLYVIFPVLLCPLSGEAQKINTGFNSSSFLSFSNITADGPPQSMQSPEPNPFARPGGEGYQQSDTQAADSLSALKENKWISTAGVYAFSAAPTFYSPSFNAIGAGDWDGVLSGAITAHLNRSKTTGLTMSSDFESYGERRQTGAGGQPGGQTLTMEWEVSHLLPSKLGLIEVAAGRYQQQIVSFSPYANAPLTDVLLGYTASSVGFETSVTLPDKNLTFSFRSGTEHVGADKARVAIFELSWNW